MWTSSDISKLSSENPMIKCYQLIRYFLKKRVRDFEYIIKRSITLLVQCQNLWNEKNLKAKASFYNCTFLVLKNDSLKNCKKLLANYSYFLLRPNALNLSCHSSWFWRVSVTRLGDFWNFFGHKFSSKSGPNSLQF